MLLPQLEESLSCLFLDHPVIRSKRLLWVGAAPRGERHAFRVPHHHRAFWHVLAVLVGLLILL